MKILLSFLWMPLYVQWSFGQTIPFNPLFDQSRVNSIYISIDPDSLNMLYSDLASNHEYNIQFVYDDGTDVDTLTGVGFRLRGNTSRFSQKKSFKVSFNTFEQGQKYHGVEKLNLNGSHNDPSMIREKLYYDIWNQFDLPARRSAFMKVFINNIYYGLYTGIEEMDETWCKDRFGDNSGNLYKCVYPADLDYLGPDQDDYKSIEAGTVTGGRAYDLQNNEATDDYSDLVDLITVINETPVNDFTCQLEKIFDADAFLRAYALDVATGNWDDYAYNKNNFFLYHNQFTHRFEFIAYDCDNTFGVDWFNVDWVERNIYSWENSTEDRPLVTRMLSVPAYKDRFSYYMNQLVNTLLLPQNITPHIDSMKTLITPAALDDEFRTYDYGYDDDDFFNSFNTNNIDGHTPYGINNFIEGRRTQTMGQLQPNNILPIVWKEQHQPLLPDSTDLINVTVTGFDDGNIQEMKCYYSFDSITFVQSTMADDGLHNDSLAADGIYGEQIPPAGNNGFVYYHFKATDNTGLTGILPACGDFKYRIGFEPPLLFINEFMASNTVTIADNDGEFDDYAEIYNGGTTSVYLGDKYLSDDFSNPAKWKLPAVTLNANGYLLLWTDNDPDQGSHHADFSLDANGEQLGVFSAVSDYFAPIDTITFGQQVADISEGRLPNGFGPVTTLPGPTPGYDNYAVGVSMEDEGENVLQLYPNPAHLSTTIHLQVSHLSYVSLQLCSPYGAVIQQEEGLMTEGGHNLDVSLLSLPAGIYLVRVIIAGEYHASKLIVL